MHRLTADARDERGFSLIEMMVSSVVMLIVLAEAMTAFDHAVRANETVTLLADSNQALRSGTQFIVRDLLQAGWGGDTIRRGIPIPTGTGALPVNRPSPPGLSYAFDDTLGVIPAVTPGASLGPAVSGVANPTDIVTIMYKDNDPTVDNLPVSVASDGASMVVPTGMNLMQGDLVLFTNTSGATAMQEVTRTQGQTVYFETTDVSDLNQRGAESGSIMELRTGATFTGISATRVKMISYFLDNTTDPDAPRLVRQENYRTPRAMAGAMDDLQITYDLVDGVTNPTGIENPTDPGPNQIRKVNLEVGVRSENMSGQQRKYARNRVRTQISLRSMSFIDRYE